MHGLRVDGGVPSPSLKAKGAFTMIPISLAEAQRAQCVPKFYASDVRVKINPNIFPRSD
jgi:hypothetical protein